MASSLHYHTRYGLACHPFGDDGVQIMSLGGQRTTSPRHKVAITAVIEQFRDGAARDEGLDAVTGAGLSRAELDAAFDFLKGRLLLVPGEVRTGHDLLVSVIAASHPRGRDPEFDPVARIADRTIGVVGGSPFAAIVLAALGRLAANTTAVSLDELDGWLEGAPSEALLVTATDSEDFAELRDINRRAVAAGVRGYFLRLSGSQLVMGPYVIPRQTPCFGCFADRLESNIMFIKEFRERSTDAAGSPLQLAPESLLSDGIRYHAAADLSWHLAGRSDVSRTIKMRYLDLATGEIETSNLLRAPRCSVCGSGRADQPKWAVRDLL